jgi:hypothetical protein
MLRDVIISIPAKSCRVTNNYCNNQLIILSIQKPKERGGENPQNGTSKVPSSSFFTSVRVGDGEYLFRKNIFIVVFWKFHRAPTLMENRSIGASLR